MASIVKCPELCGRGAISLTRRASIRGQKELDRQDADRAQRLRDASARRMRFLGDDRPDPAGMTVGVEDVAVVTVHGDRIANGLAVNAASHDHRELSGEIDHAPPPHGAPAQARPRRRLRHFRFDQNLSLAVIARRGGLQDQRQAELRRRSWSSASLRTGRQGVCGMSCAGQKLLFAKPILADPGRLPAGANHPAARQPAQCGGRNVFELNGDRARALGKLTQGRQIIRATDDPPVSDLRGGVVSCGGQNARRDSPSAAPPG